MPETHQEYGLGEMSDTARRIYFTAGKRGAARKAEALDSRALDPPKASTPVLDEEGSAPMASRPDQKFYLKSSARKACLKQARKAAGLDDLLLCR